jgi:methylated-DNA-[protein]-cysteine S-methyltransferase
MQKSAFEAQWKIHSPLGALYLVASARGLRQVSRRKCPSPMVSSLKGNAAEIQILAQAARELGEYFAGQRQRFQIPLDPQGTPFQQQVWRELQKIPFGTTCSYGDIARHIKNPRAVRAVGGANGKNPLCIVIPCHRVIATDGSIGGYSGGLAMKRKLLALERSTLDQA